jgi:hypothetical protein
MTKRNWGRLAFSIATWSIALIMLAIAISSTPPENCWDKYQTEDEAIMNCESHE